jgi:hypothetical protein
MLGSIRVTRVDADGATVQPTGQPQANIASWQHYGTHGPYPIRPRIKKALSFPATGRAGSYSNSVRVGSRFSRQGQQFYSLSSFSGSRRKVTGMTTVAGVMHPGLSPRPFFGLSPSDQRSIEIRAERWLDEQQKMSGLA